MLELSESPLASAYDLAMLDLDGVVYVGSAGVPHAAQALAEARSAGLRLAFITNNASRPPAEVVRHLPKLDIAVAPGEVVTSAQAAASLLAGRLGRGAAVAVLGAEGLRLALCEAGLTPVPVEAPAQAIVTGYGPQVLWREVMRAGTRIREGL